jgi:hypothetical protein
LALAVGGQFASGQNALRKPLAVPIQRRLNAPDVAQIGANAKDHDAIEYVASQVHFMRTLEVFAIKNAPQLPARARWPAAIAFR